MPVDFAATHHFFLATFRSSRLYTFSFTPSTNALVLEHTNTASGGHNWLDLSPDKKYLYATGWTDPPTLAAYKIVSAPAARYPAVQLINTVTVTHTPGYICSNGKAIFSVSGPQGDVFLVDPVTGGFKTQEPQQSVRFAQGIKNQDPMDFGGLRHGAHSADFSPDGSKLYIADLGNNCTWTFRIGTDASSLTFSSKTPARKENDGPRHAWPHPNGQVVYCINEHSSTIDVFEYHQDVLVWRQRASVIPENADCNDFWADEVRLSPTLDTLFGSTRGLTRGQKGYITAFSLLPSGLLKSPIPLQIFQTKTSGGIANAIAPCPVTGPAGETYMTLTDSEQGFVQIVKWSDRTGLQIVAEATVDGAIEETGGPSVAVWYD